MGPPDYTNHAQKGFRGFLYEETMKALPMDRGVKLTTLMNYFIVPSKKIRTEEGADRDTRQSIWKRILGQLDAEHGRSHNKTEKVKIINFYCVNGGL
jgi:hypothetical protein